jgi:hypothetical protein
MPVLGRLTWDPFGNPAGWEDGRRLMFRLVGAGDGDWLAGNVLMELLLVSDREERERSDAGSDKPGERCCRLQGPE